MLHTLLESGAKADRSASGPIISVSAHTAIIAAAIFATTHSHLAVRNTPDAVHPVYFPPSSPQVATTQNSVVTKPAKVSPPKWINLRSIDPVLPSLDVGLVPSPPIDFGTHSIGSVPATASHGTSGSATDAPYRADEVEAQASFIAGSGSPRYPDVLRSSGVEGQVVTVFVVNERGRAEADSVRFIRSDNRLFEDAVRAALPRMRFVAAEIGGRKVRQLVQMPFVFTIGK